MEDPVPASVPHDGFFHSRCPSEAGAVVAQLKDSILDDEVIVARVPIGKPIEPRHKLPDRRVRVDDRGADERATRGTKPHVDTTAVHFFVRPVAFIGGVAVFVPFVIPNATRTDESNSDARTRARVSAVAVVLPGVVSLAWRRQTPMRMSPSAPRIRVGPSPRARDMLGRWTHISFPL